MIVFSIALVIVMLVQLLVLKSDNLIFILCSCLCSLLFSVPLAFNNKSRFYHPYVFILLATFIGVTLRSFYMVYRPDDPIINSFFLRNQSIAYFTAPTFMLFTGLLAFALSYSFTKGKIGLQNIRLFKKNYGWNQQRVGILTIIFSLISVTGIFLFIRVMGIGSILLDISGKRFMKVGEGADTTYASYGYYRIMASFVQPLLYIYLLNFIVQKKRILSKYGIILIGIALANLFFPIFTSSRSDLLTIFLNVFIILSTVGKFDVKLIIAIAPIAMMLFAITTLLRPAKSNDIDTEKINLLEPFIYNKNLLDVSKTAHVINGVPQKMPFQYGASFLSLIYAPIPRDMWPEKPNLSISKDVSHKIYGYSENNGAGIPPGMAAEMYINFGYAGILIAFFLVGILLKKTYNSFEFDEKELIKNRAVLYVTLVVSITITLFGSSLNQAILGILQNYIPLWIGLRFITDYNKIDSE